MWFVSSTCLELRKETFYSLLKHLKKRTVAYKTYHPKKDNSIIFIWFLKNMVLGWQWNIISLIIVSTYIYNNYFNFFILSQDRLKIIHNLNLLMVKKNLSHLFNCRSGFRYQQKTGSLTKQLCTTSCLCHRIGTFFPQNRVW